MTDMQGKSSLGERVHLSTRVDPKLAAQIAVSAKANLRSVSSEIAYALEAQFKTGHPTGGS